jgi:hypothetical protein
MKNRYFSNRDLASGFAKFGAIPRALFIVLLFLIASTFLQGQSLCDLYKEGEFGYVNAQYRDWEIERIGEYQLEHSKKYDVLFVATIEWTDQCSYTLQYISIDNPKYFGAYGELVHCTIEPVDQRHYYIYAEMDGETDRYLMEMDPVRTVVDNDIWPVK